MLVKIQINHNFFITFKSCKHLDKKHTIFGRLVGGFETLDKIENSLVDKQDRPIKDVLIESTPVFVDPFEEVDQELEEERRKAIEEKESSNNKKQANKGELSKIEIESCKRKIGALINLDKLKMKVSESVRQEVNGQKKKKANSSSFGNFTSW